MVGESSFFADSGDDDLLEFRNHVFWEAMLDNMRLDGFTRVPQKVLDIGCHRGGLLARIAQTWGSNELWGIEPISAARARAQLRLASLAKSVRMLTPEQWKLVPDRTIDLVVCHETLFMLDDLNSLVGHIARVLAPGGRAYIVAGCHAENPVWLAWRDALELEGKTVFTHEPIALMSAAGSHGLVPAVRPLRTNGWATYDPNDSLFAFSSVGALLDHQFRHKLLFRLGQP
jgi:SAM-dependent methyltransferase